jgi:hypothetical protein
MITNLNNRPTPQWRIEKIKLIRNWHSMVGMVNWFVKENPGSRMELCAAQMFGFLYVGEYQFFFHKNLSLSEVQSALKKLKQ